MNKGDEPAFSKAAFYHQYGGVDNPQTGLTKREYFAAMAMQGMLSANQPDDIPNDKFWFEILANDSILAADELLKQLSE